MFGMQMGRMGQTGAASWLQTFNSLYANGEQGIAKLDFSGFAGMYQDRARTIPYTAVEQPLGSFTGLNGVTATAPADVNRGVVSARVNLLLDTEDLTAVASWTPMNSGTGSVPIITPGQLAPDGTLTATRIQLDRGAGTSSSDYSLVRQAIGDGITLRSRKVWVKSNTGIDQTFALIATISDSVVTAKSSWGEVSPDDHPAAQTDFSTYGPVPTSQVVDILVWHPSMVDVANAHLPYQRVNTPTDYDTAGFPHYLAFNGTNTAYVTPSIDFTGTDKMTVWAGVTKLSDANLAVITELSNGAVDGVISLQAPFGSASPSFLYLSRGSTSQWAATVAYPSPSTAVLTGVSDISGDVVSLRVNATVVATTTTDQGVGNYGNYPLYIGSRSGASNYFNGRLYTLIVRGAQSSLSQIEAVETLIRQKMRLP